MVTGPSLDKENMALFLERSYQSITPKVAFVKKMPNSRIPGQLAIKGMIDGYHVFNLLFQTEKKRRREVPAIRFSPVEESDFTKNYRDAVLNGRVEAEDEPRYKKIYEVIEACSQQFKKAFVAYDIEIETRESGETETRKLAEEKRAHLLTRTPFPDSYHVELNMKEGEVQKKMELFRKAMQYFAGNIRKIKPIYEQLRAYN
jgi:hypothetical protein